MPTKTFTNASSSRVNAMPRSSVWAPMRTRPIGLAGRGAADPGGGTGAVLDARGAHPEEPAFFSRFVLEGGEGRGELDGLAVAREDHLDLIPGMGGDHRDHLGPRVAV